MKQFEKIAEREIPIYTDLNPGPNGEVDCLQKRIRKKYLRYIMAVKLKQKYESEQKNIQQAEGEK